MYVHVDVCDRIRKSGFPVGHDPLPGLQTASGEPRNAGTPHSPSSQVRWRAGRAGEREREKEREREGGRVKPTLSL